MAVEQAGLEKEDLPCIIEDRRYQCGLGQLNVYLFIVHSLNEPWVCMKVTQGWNDSHIGSTNQPLSKKMYIDASRHSYLAKAKENNKEMKSHPQGQAPITISSPSSSSVFISPTG